MVSYLEPHVGSILEHCPRFQGGTLPNDAGPRLHGVGFHLELPLLGFSLWSVISLVVLLAGAYGVSQRSRTAAVLLLIYYVVGQVSLRLQYPEVGYSSMFIVVIFGILYLRGAVAAFTYHRLDAEGLESDDTAATPVGVGGRGDPYG